MGRIKVQIIEAEERWNVTPDELQYMDADEVRQLMAAEDGSEWEHE